MTLASAQVVSGAARRTFVLVHGAWHGGWCWTRVQGRLEAAGHRVFAPTLTGLGERSHLLDTRPDLSTHIQDLVNVVLWEDLHEITLVAHSYGSWVASGALEQIHDRVRAVVFIDCYLPEDGQQLVDFGRPESVAALWEAQREGAAGRAAPSASEFGVVVAADREWVDAKTTPQPIGPSFEPIKLTGARDRVAVKWYLRAPSYRSPRFDRVREQLAERSDWHVRDVPGGHDVMIDEPELLTSLLLELTG